MILNDAMIDLETLSVQPTAAVIQIGFMRFDMVSGAKGIGDRLNISLDSCLSKGLTIEESTWRFWMEQSQRRVVDHLFDKPALNLEDALEITSAMIPSNSRLWSRGASFDIPILTNLFYVCKMKMPWSFSNFLCQRTAVNHANLLISKLNLKLPTIKKTEAHNSLRDCEYQIDCLVTTNRIVRDEVARLQNIEGSSPKDAA